MQWCYAGNCASYVWQSSSWGGCSASCGGGLQSRSVSCVLSGTSTAAAESNCAFAGTKPAASQMCNTSPCPSVGSNACGSLDCGSNGLCLTAGSSKFCACLNGYAGTECTVAPSISNVQATVSAGTVQVTWDKTGGFTSVQVIMNQNGVVPYTITASASNSGSYSFTPSSFSSALCSVEIRSNAVARGISNSFILAGCAFV